MRHTCSTFTAVALVGLVGCMSGPRPFQDGPQGIALRWYTNQGTLEEAQAQADGHCRSWGKHAMLIDEFEDQDITTAQFACR